MTVEEETKGAANEFPQLSNTQSTKGLFSSFRDHGEDVSSTPSAEGSAKSRTSGFFSSPKNGSRSPVPSTPVPVVLSLNVQPFRNNLTKLLTPSRTFSRLRDEREELSRQTPTPTSSKCFKDRIKLPLVGEVRLDHAGKAIKKWLRNPKNLALLFWGLAVGVSGALLFMVMVGMLGSAIPNKNERNTLFEVSNQIINALFTLMCVYLHPVRCFHLHMLIRWSASDILKLRAAYCKNGTRKPHEWAHMLVVVSLLQLNCWAQYALCGLNWGYRRAERPALGVGLCLCLSLGGAAGAGIYNTLSPLGKDFEVESDGSEDVEAGKPETHRHYEARDKIYRMLERRVSFANREEGSVVENPEWRGGVFDCGQDPPVAVLSTLCCPCVFGWNMDRLGFGNRYVHIVTFLLLCTAPFWIFDLAAINIANRTVRRSIGGAGIVLCAFGLLYGGFWRIRMRERFKLPGNGCCCGYPNVADCAQWMFCPLCSLCQEVRTAEHYDVRDDKFYSRGHREVAPPLPVSPPNGSQNGSVSPRTPATTLPAVQEMPPTGTKDEQTEIELNGSTNPFSESGDAPNGHSPLPTNPFLTPEDFATFNPRAPPSAVTASRESTTFSHGVTYSSLGTVPTSIGASERSVLSPGNGVYESPEVMSNPRHSTFGTEKETWDSPGVVTESNRLTPQNENFQPRVRSNFKEETAYESSGLPMMNSMFLRTELGAYVSPDSNSNLSGSFLQTPDAHYESPRFSSLEEEEMRHMSPNNPFLEPNMGVNSVKSPLSLCPDALTSNSAIPTGEVNHGIPHVATAGDRKFHHMSPNNPFLEPKMVAEKSSPLSTEISLGSSHEGSK